MKENVRQTTKEILLVLWIIAVYVVSVYIFY